MERIEMTAGRSPTVYVIAGPNGVGETRFATDFLPDFVQCREFVNADLIAAGLSHFAPETLAGLRNFFPLYAPLVKSWYLHNGAQLPPRSIADSIDGTVRVHLPELFQMTQTD
jgi:hypothetical protein